MNRTHRSSVRMPARIGVWLAAACAALALLPSGAPRPALAADRAPLNAPADLPGPPQGAPAIGFLAASREAEARSERIFLGTPAPARARAWLRALTEEPHVAGTPADKRSAEYVRDRLKEFGLQAEINTYEVLLNYPKSVSLRMLQPEQADLSLREAGDPRDKDSYSGDVYPAFHGYGAEGTATGQVVYANYGTREDFERLDTAGVSAEGRIVIVRYGKNFRGLKVKEAQDRGARGMLIYSDPQDDGYVKGDVYPDGPMRPSSAIQRGSVQFLSQGPGDPSTPGYASTRGARRAQRDAMTGIPRIPSLPLSWGEASKILKALAGERVPDDWQGGLPFAYHLGPGPAEVAMSVTMDYAVRPIWNIIATIPGTVETARQVILGNHRDAWTYGAVDPNSGTASFLETARGLGAALKEGWKPRRTLILASWDAEEYGLVGSTEWVEDRLDSLQQNGVAYINLDSSVTGGDLDVEGIPSLRDLVVEVAGGLTDPRLGTSLLEAWRSRLHREWAKTEPPCLGEASARFDLRLGPLGSGSDYTAFIDHAGVASLNFSFNGPYGVYHSIYDNIFWMEHFGDPEFLYHTLASRFYGLIAMRLAAAEIVPLRYGAYGAALAAELTDLERDTLRQLRMWRAASEGAGPADPGSASAVEGRRKPALDPDFTPIREAIRRLGDAAEALDRAVERLQEATQGRTDPSLLPRLNEALVGVERAFLDARGLPGRPWFRHMLYAPGLTTGYASWPFPGVVQALKERDPAALEAQMRALLERLKAGMERIDQARRLAEGASP